MHTGKKNQHLCPSLSIHGTKMLKSETQKYLGDVLSTSGKINENITNRYNKGVGKVNEIMGILQEVSFGPLKRSVFKKLITEKIQHITAKYLISLKLLHS